MTIRPENTILRMADTDRSICEVIAQNFSNAGIRRVYTVPGDLTYGLLRAFDQVGLAIYSCRSQAAAVFASAADSFAQGNLASVVLVSRGPASQNAMAAVSSVLAHGTPILLLSPVESDKDTKRGAFQGGGLDMLPENGSCQLLRLKDPAMVNAEVSTILRASMSPARVSAVIEIERSVLGSISNAGTDTAPEEPKKEAQASADHWLTTAVDILANARRTAVVVGHIARWSVTCEALAGISRLLNAPLCPTGLTVGFGGSEIKAVPQNLVHKTLADADAVLLLGASLDWSLRFGAAIGESAAVVHLLHGEANPHLGRQADVVANGDIGANLSILSQCLPKHGREVQKNLPDETAHSRRLSHCRSAAPKSLIDKVFQSVGDSFPSNAGLVLDGSSRLIASAQNIVPENAWARITPGVAGHLGSGIGHALGAIATGRFEQVLLVIGDFSLGLAMGDLETLVRYNTPVKILVSSNRGLASDRHQLAGADPRIASYSHTVDHTSIMRAFGGTGYSVRTPGDWDAIAPRVFSSTTPCLVDIIS